MTLYHRRGNCENTINDKKVGKVKNCCPGLYFKVTHEASSKRNINSNSFIIDIE